ncbi:MAG: type II toxin-antitoxin system ParD family antitoxin [Blastocatellia bacterium]
MSITLTPEQEAVINQKLQSGRYTSATDVIDEGLRLLEEKDQERQKLEELRAEVHKGLEQLERGEYLTFDSAMEIKAHIQNRIQQHLASPESGEGA